MLSPKERQDVEAAVINAKDRLKMIAVSDIADLIAGQKRLLQARSTSMMQEIEQLGKRRAQTADQIVGIEAQQKALSRQLELISKELKDQQTLLEKGLCPLNLAG